MALKSARQRSMMAARSTSEGTRYQGSERSALENVKEGPSRGAKEKVPALGVRRNLISAALTAVLESSWDMEKHAFLVSDADNGAKSRKRSRLDIMADEQPALKRRIMLKTTLGNVDLTDTERWKHGFQDPALEDSSISCFDFLDGARGVRFAEINKQVDDFAASRLCNLQMLERHKESPPAEAKHSATELKRSLTSSSFISKDRLDSLDLNFEVEIPPSSLRTPSPWNSPKSHRGTIGLVRNPTWLSESVSPSVQPLQSSQDKPERTLSHLSDISWTGFDHQDVPNPLESGTKTLSQDSWAASPEFWPSTLSNDSFACSQGESLQSGSLSQLEFLSASQ